MAAAFGSDRLTSGDPASLRRSSFVPSLLSKSMWPHDMARSRAGPVSRPMSFKAQYLLLEIAVLRTYQQTSLVYRRHPLAAPSHVGTWCDSFSILPKMGPKTRSRPYRLEVHQKKKKWDAKSPITALYCLTRAPSDLTEGHLKDVVTTSATPKEPQARWPAPLPMQRVLQWLLLGLWPKGCPRQFTPPTKNGSHGSRLFHQRPLWPKVARIWLTRGPCRAKTQRDASRWCKWHLSSGWCCRFLLKVRWPSPI